MGKEFVIPGTLGARESILDKLHKELRSRTTQSAKSNYLVRVFHELMGNGNIAGGKYAEYLENEKKAVNYQDYIGEEAQETIANIASLLGRHRGKPYVKKLLDKYLAPRDLLKINLKNLGQMQKYPGCEDIVNDLIFKYGEEHILSARQKNVKLNGREVAYFDFSIDGKVTRCIEPRR